MKEINIHHLFTSSPLNEGGQGSKKIRAATTIHPTIIIAVILFDYFEQRVTIAVITLIITNIPMAKMIAPIMATFWLLWSAKNP
jgi:hypothetical protein